MSKNEQPLKQTRDSRQTLELKKEISSLSEKIKVVTKEIIEITRLLSLIKKTSKKVKDT
mgnify:CR=1 FL=1